MNVIGIIPARMGSRRFPGKPLEPILGVPMLKHCFERTIRAKLISEVYIATCDEIIFEYARKINAKCVMTSPKHTRATGRTAEAIKKVEDKENKSFDIVIMVQGDEPTISPESIDETLKHFQDKNINVVNIMNEIPDYDSFISKDNVKVVVDKNNFAMYMSREPIPSPWIEFGENPKYMQNGIIAFRRKSLEEFLDQEETPCEINESVDMNRILENGNKIKMIPINYPTIGVDSKEDLILAEKILANDPLLKDYV